MLFKTVLASCLCLAFSFLVCLTRENLSYSFIDIFCLGLLRYISFLGSSIIWLFACIHLTRDYCSTKKYSYYAQDFAINKLCITFITLVCIDIPLGYFFANEYEIGLMIMSYVVKFLFSLYA